MKKTFLSIMNSRKLFSLFLLHFFFAVNDTEAQSFEWVKHFEGPGFNAASVKSMALDDAGNIYSTGDFVYTVDFDPGPDTFYFATVGQNRDAFVSKLDASGNFVWAIQFGNSLQDGGTSITTDKFGNVYVAGYFEGTIDFDPGPGVFNLIAPDYTDAFVLKLDTAGNFKWAIQLGGPGSDEARFITVDSSGNIYVTGFFFLTADFDPGPGTFNLTAPGHINEIFVAKLDSSGSLIWAKRMGGTEADRAFSLTLDVSGNIYVTGDFKATADFDPGPGIFNLTSAGERDVFVSKLDATGNFVWAIRLGGPSDDIGYSMAVNNTGDIYVTGLFFLTADFDPGPGTFNLTSAGAFDMFVVKLNSSGSLIWVKQMGGSSIEVGLGLALDAAGNIFTTGYFVDTVNFAGVTLISKGNWDYFISKLDSSGNLLWVEHFGGGETDVSSGQSVKLDNSGNIFTTGSFEGDVDFHPGPGTYILSHYGFGGSNGFIHKLKDCLVTTSTQTASACGSYPWNGNNYTASGTYSTTLLNASGCDSILTLELTVNEIFSSSDTVSACGSFVWNGNTYTTSGTYTANLQSAAGCDSTLTLQLTISAADTSVTVSNNTLTATATAATYQWLDCDDNFSAIADADDASFTATATGNYAVAVTQNSCIDTSSCFNITVTGLSGNIATNVLSVFPNPSSNGLFTIDCREWRNTTYEVKDVTGRIILTGTFDAQQTVLDLTSAENGMYFLSAFGQTIVIVKQ